MAGVENSRPSHQLYLPPDNGGMQGKTAYVSRRPVAKRLLQSGKVAHAKLYMPPPDISCLPAVRGFFFPPCCAFCCCAPLPPPRCFLWPCCACCAFRFCCTACLVEDLPTRLGRSLRRKGGPQGK